MRPITVAFKLYDNFHHERITYIPASPLILTVNGIYEYQILSQKRIQPKVEYYNSWTTSHGYIKSHNALERLFLGTVLRFRFQFLDFECRFQILVSDKVLKKVPFLDFGFCFFTIWVPVLDFGFSCHSLTGCLAHSLLKIKSQNPKLWANLEPKIQKTDPKIQS